MLRHHRSVMRSGATAVLLLLSVSAAACSKTEVDRVQLETQVQRSLEVMTDPKMDVRTVSCPDHLEARTGAQTHCSITTTAGNTVSALVTVRSTNNNRLQFDLKLEQRPK
jgi:Ser-tRNA(Ala) deacylase AlaX